MNVFLIKLFPGMSLIRKFVNLVPNISMVDDALDQKRYVAYYDKYKSYSEYIMVK